MQESRDASGYGIGGNAINREHVWAKSHGDFAEVRPMDGDAFNLRPADAEVNEDRGNLDFDNVAPGGIQHSKATDCYYNGSAWEPGPLTKGQVARILFYMATRYEGLNDELDLEVVEGVNTYPKPEHGNLSALLEWNNAYPPSDFERRRNERIYGAQQNRNPFIDNPNLANLIWGTAEPSVFVSNNFSMQPEFPLPGTNVDISVALENGSATPTSVMLYWGKQYDSEEFSTELQADQNTYSSTIQLPNYTADSRIYFTLKMQNETDTLVQHANYVLPKSFSEQDFTPIKEVQGSGDSSPILGEVVTISGRITSNFDGSYYVQDGFSARDGVCIYGALATGNIGDSVVLTGKVTEYENLTEISDITYFYNFGDQQEVEPLRIDITEVNEDHEGMLVQISEVSFDRQGRLIPNENTTYDVSKREGSTIVYSRNNSRLVGHRTPTGKINLVGVVSQYRNTYQILPRDMDDFRLYTNAPVYSTQSEITVYPNPVKEVVKVSTASSIKALRVFDFNGRMLLVQNGSKQELSVGRLTEGFYLLEVTETNGKRQLVKFVKSK